MRLNEQRHRVDRWSGPCISMLGCAFRAHSRPWAFSVRNEGDEEERRDVKEGMLNAECRSRGSPYTCSTPKPPRSNSPGKRQILFLLSPLSLHLWTKTERESIFFLKTRIVYFVSELKKERHVIGFQLKMNIERFLYMRSFFFTIHFFNVIEREQVIYTYTTFGK